MLMSKTSSGRGELEKLLAVRIDTLRAGKTLFEIRVLSAMMLIVFERDVLRRC